MEIYRKLARPVPSLEPSVGQRAQMDRKFGMFLHFGVNTFGNVEWSDGGIPAKSYKPEAIDAEQWVRTAWEAGMNYVVLITKHHDGFCLWNTEYTEYSVKNSGNTTDVVKAVSQACSKYGMKLGLYYSLWDRSEASYKKDFSDGYVPYMQNQLTELMDGRYGEIVELWLDGGWDKPRRDWRLDLIYDLVKRLQPMCQIGINHTVGTDDNMASVPEEYYMPVNYEKGDPVRMYPSDFRLWDPHMCREDDPKIYTYSGKEYYMPFEMTICSREGFSWFYSNIYEDKPFLDVRETAERLQIIFKTENMAVINMPPDTRGRLCEGDIEHLMEIADRLGITRKTKMRRCTGLGGEDRSYIRYPKAVPPQPESPLIEAVKLDAVRYHCGEGDMWPLTWGKDNNIYASAGDNKGVSMNLWKISGHPAAEEEKGGFAHGKLTNTGDYTIDLQNPEPVDYRNYTGRTEATGIKPAGILDIGGILYYAVQIHHYGDNPAFNRQKNLHGFIMTSKDYGKTWDTEATPSDFFEGRLSSCHFLQFGRGYDGARDGYVYAYFPCDEDGSSYWENNDGLLLGRVPAERITQRSAWEFYSGNETGESWSSKEEDAVFVFSYYKMTGENHVCYNPGLKRYLMGNYGFIDEELYPRPVHQMKWPESHISQLTLFEAEEPWGPWKLFYRDDNWGTYGDYQPVFPTKWINEDGRLLAMVSSGSFDDYNFVVQKLALKCSGDRDFPPEAGLFDFLSSPTNHSLLSNVKKQA